MTMSGLVSGCDENVADYAGMAVHWRVRAGQITLKELKKTNF